MEKITFVNNQAPALNATNLNLLQDNVEEAIEDVKEQANSYASSTNVGGIKIRLDGSILYIRTDGNDA